MSARHRIALIPGDGIGREVLPAGVLALEAAGRRHGVEFAWTEYDWGCERYTSRSGGCSCRCGAASASTPACARSSCCRG